MSLLDDLRNLLARHLAHVSSQTNQGVARLIEDHLARLDAVVGNDLAAAEAKVHEILGELYAATNAPVSAAPSAPAEPVIVAAPAPVDPAPAVSSAPAELPAPEPAPLDPAAPEPTADAPTETPAV